MKHSGHIFRLVTCTVAFASQVLCSDGIAYCHTVGLGDNLSDGSDSVAIVDKIAPPLRITP